ncbi:MAG: hypothetical protein ACOCQA_01905 [bacterium]
MEINKIIKYDLILTEGEAKKLFDFVDNYLSNNDEMNSEREKEVLRKVYKLIGNYQI